MNPKFPTGRVVTTPAAQDKFGVPFLARCLERHVQGDWGDLDKTDLAANERALKSGSRLMSVYTLNNERLYVITESDRSVTTFLLPEEY